MDIFITQSIWLFLFIDIHQDDPDPLFILWLFRCLWDFKYLLKFNFNFAKQLMIPMNAKTFAKKFDWVNLKL